MEARYIIMRNAHWHEAHRLKSSAVIKNKEFPSPYVLGD